MRFLVIFLAFLFSIFNSVSAHSQTVIIEMTEEGFSPQSVTLDESSAVIFINKDTKDRWPASNIHPTHELYPEFDPKKPIRIGESWPFKVQRKGEWKFHDHLIPHFRGVMKVEAEAGVKSEEDKQTSFIERIKIFFSGFYEKFKQNLLKVRGFKAPVPDEFKKLNAAKQIDTLSKMASVNGAERTWNYFKGIFKGEAGSTGNIHDLAHLLGKLIYEQKGFSGIGICTQEFAFGCFHGFLDKAFEKSLDKLNEAEKACLSLGTGGPFASCAHGIGHGIASFYQTADLKSSLTSCRKLTSGQQYCYDGVFMEFERAAPSTFYSRENPYKPCDELEKEFGGEFSFACGRNQPTALIDRFKFNFDQVIEVCLKSTSPQFKTACFDALGFIITKSTSQASQIISFCNKIGQSEYILRCAKAAAGELIFQEVPGWQIQAPLICENLTPDERQDCTKYLDDLKKQYSREPAGKLRLKRDGEADDAYLREELKVCFDLGGRDDCYKEAALLFFNHFGLKKSLDLLERNEDYQEVYARCHEVTHFLSRSEYEKLKSIADVYSQCNSTCHGGCYHGTLEAYLKENSDIDFALICGKIDDYDKPLIFYECFHGLGHAAMYVEDMDLLASLRMCDKINDTANRERCYSGVFMENSSSSTSLDHPGKYTKADDPYFPCNSLEEKYLSLCYRYQSSYFSLLVKHDWQKVAGLCLGVPEDYRHECFRTIGTNQVGFTKDPLKMRANCYLMPTDDFRNTCITGVISSFAYRFVGDGDKMINFCSSVEDNYKESCYKQIGAAFSDWSADKDLARSGCEKIADPKAKEWCRS